ncbi:uncharacterized protein LOC143273016 isoform X10 [Peromyscus maniculatus bairdii]|uniref:uncharacterized protein LOC143273016 isoform X10 n=1 Tax=Peromyscus maniculatus bairdii TaxID=230844 RepID=UPI003FD12C86
MPRLGAVRRLPPSAGRSDARLPAGHRRNPTGAEQCPCAAEKTARVSWADPNKSKELTEGLRSKHRWQRMDKEPAMMNTKSLPESGEDNVENRV